MKLFLDTKARRFVKSAASNVALSTLHLKRRDQVPIEIVFVANNAVVTATTGTATTVGLKAKFSDANFLAYAAPGTNTLNLNTEPVEAAFSSNPASLPALLEVRWSAPGESLRTATLQVELQNSVILGTEGTPAAALDLKATQPEAEAGTDNAKWMTPLRAWDAIRAWAAANFSWANLAGKPTSFPPSSHTHTASQITDFSAAVVAAAPPTTDASLLTSGTLADARLSATVTASLAKADTASQPGHGHSISDVANLATALAEKATITSVTTVSEALTAESQARAAGDSSLAGGLASEASTRAAADTALSERIDFLAENLDPAALDSIAEAAASIGSLQTQIDGKAPTSHTHPISQVTGLSAALDGKQPTGSYATLVNGTVPADQLPSYVDDVVEYANLAAFPATGETGKIFVAADTRKVYRWAASAISNGLMVSGAGTAAANGAYNQTTDPAIINIVKSYWEDASEIWKKAGAQGIYFFKKSTSTSVDPGWYFYNEYTNTYRAVFGSFAQVPESPVGLTYTTVSGTAPAPTVTAAPSGSYIEISPSEVTSVNGYTGSVTLTKSDVGLSNVANTAPADLPISTATQTALDGKAAAEHASRHLPGGSDQVFNQLLNTDSDVAFAAISAPIIQNASTNTAISLEENKLRLIAVDNYGGNINSNISVEAPIAFEGPNAIANAAASRAAIGAASEAALDGKADSDHGHDISQINIGDPEGFLEDLGAALESSLGTLSTQDSESVEITGGSAHFDTLSAGNDHAAVNGNLTIAANGDIIGTGANKLLGFIAGGATY